MEAYEEHTGPGLGNPKSFGRTTEKKPPSVSTYLTKNPSQTGPKKKKVPKPQAPLLDPEKRLDELSKVAQDNISLYDIAFQHQKNFQAPFINAPSNNSSDRTMSGTEAAFLLRQINSGDPSGLTGTPGHELSLFSNPDEFSSTFNSTVSRNLLSGLSGTTPMTGHARLSAPPPGSTHSSHGSGVIEQKIFEEMIKALQDKVRLLEDSQRSLQEQLRQKDQELDKKTTRLEQLQQESESNRLALQKELKNAKEEHEMAILKLQEKHAREKSNLIMSVPSAASSSSSSSSSSSAPTSASAPPLEASKQLLNQINTLRKELKDTIEKHSEEKVQLQKETIEKNFLLEKRFKEEMNRVKDSANKIEEEVFSLRDKCTKYESELTKLRMNNSYLENLNKTLSQDVSKSKNDLKAMQKTIQSTTRFEASSTGPAGGMSHEDPEEDGRATLLNSLSIPIQNSLKNFDLPGDVLMIIKQIDARNDAKIRQISNKLEYLKNQLDTERKIVSDTNASLQETYANINAIKEEHANRLEQFQRDKEQEIREVEQKVTENYEKRMTELTILQRQIHQLNNKTNDLSTENLTYKQREESLEAQLHRVTAQVETYRAQVEELKRQNILLVEKDMEEKSMKDSKKLNTDMIVRRLDNERHYLKTQLTSEITLKNEIQTILLETQETLKQTQSQWQKDVDTLKERVEELKTERDNLSQVSTRNELISKETITRLEQQNVELKDNIIAFREQIRLEQLNVESLQLDKHRLTDSVASLNAEVQRLLENNKAIETQYELQIQNLNLLLQENTDMLNKQIDNYKNELALQCSINSKAQGDLIKSKEITAQALKEAMKLNYAARIFDFLKLWRRKRAAEAFKKWSTSNLLQNIADQFKKQVENIVEETRKEEDAIKKEEIALLQKDHQKDIILKQEQTRFDCKAEEAEALERLRTEFNNQIEELKRTHEQQMDQLEQDAQFDLETLKGQHQIVVSNLEEFNKRHVEDLNLELKSKMAEYKAAVAEETEREITRAKNSVRVEFEHKMDEQKIEYEVKIEDLESNNEKKLQEALFKQRSDFDNVLKSVEDSHKKTLERELNSLRAAHQKEMDEKFATINETQKKELDDQQAKHEKHIEELNEEFARKLSDALSEQQERLNEEAQAREAELKDSLVLQFDEEKNGLILQKDNEREKQVKAEMKKWKQVLASNDERLELELKKSRSELELEFEKKIQAKQADFDLQIETRLNKQREEFKIERELAALALEEEKDRFLASLESNQQQRIQQEIEVASAKLTIELNEKAQAEIAELAIKHKAAIDKEKQKLEEVKREFQLQIRNHSEERNKMTRQQQQIEEKLRDSMKAKEALHLQTLKDLQNQKNAEIAKLEEQIKQLNESFLHQIDELKLTQEVEVEETVARVKKEEAEKHTAEFEKQIEEVKNEYQKLLLQLEEGLDNLRTEKSSLSEDIQQLKTQLEESQDALYDTQQTQKKMQKEMSFKFWMLSAKYLVTKERQKAELSLLNEDSFNKLEKISSNLQGYIHDIVFSYLKSSVFFTEIESVRHQILSTLTSYRTDELQKYKKQIQLLEIEIDNYQSEKDLLEDQRYKSQHEINFLTSEIKEQEEAMRLLQGESSMTVDGRVNVAYARKKKRIDLEIERILEQVEEKRTLIGQLDSRIHEKSKLRDEKENDLVDIERQLVIILVEQQKQVLKDVYSLSGYMEKAKTLLASVKLPWIETSEAIDVKEITRILSPVIRSLID